MKIDLHTRGVIGYDSYVKTVEIDHDVRCGPLPDVVIDGDKVYGKHSFVGRNGYPVYDERTVARAK